MTATDAATLFILAILDGAFAGFRSSAGRTGLINHRRSDHQAARRGVVLALSFTLLRRGIAILGAALAMTLANNLVVAIMAGLSAVAVLAVEPLAGRLWYARNQPGPAG